MHAPCACPPKTITLDGYAASHRAVRELQQQRRLTALTNLRSSKYLDNLIAQDHRNIKSRLGAMLGLNSFACANVTIPGVELMHRIRTGQFDLRSLGTQEQTPSEIWAAVLATPPAGPSPQSIRPCSTICTRALFAESPCAPARIPLRLYLTAVASAANGFCKSIFSACPGNDTLINC
nr:DDE-type integrase/transposase/recombinase [Massilia putida]